MPVCTRSLHGARCLDSASDAKLAGCRGWAALSTAFAESIHH